jgi:hypothetical protein
VVRDSAMDLRRASLEVRALSSERCAGIGSKLSPSIYPVTSLLRQKDWVSSSSGALQGTASRVPSRALALSNIAALVWLTGWSVPTVSVRLCFLLG